MRALTLGASVLAITAGGAIAGGIDRSGQNIGILFEPGRIIEFSLGAVNPSVDGQEAINPLTGGPGALTGNVSGDYTQLSLGYKYDVNDRVSFALIIDQPFGADILYPEGPPLLGGTRADAEATAATGILRYKFDGGFSVHGGVRAQRASAEIDLRGLAYGPSPAAGQPTLNGYSVTLEEDIAPGYLIGVAYERPDIALRVALTYNSKITHDFATTETIAGFPFPLSPGETETEVDLPQTVNLDFQSGVAENTLVFGQIRWADWSELLLSPAGFAAATDGASLIDLDDSTTFTLGVGRRFNETWSGSLSVSYEDKSDPLVSPLSPTNGRTGVTLGVVYTQDNMRISGGINYTWIGDAEPETGTPDTARASMTDNSSVGLGVRVAYTF
jgi:long-subunit fatty acid transport protein